MTIAVIGAGASGMMAALTAAEQPENKILLFERQARVGRKLAVTGNGRCNLTNTGAAPTLPCEEVLTGTVHNRVGKMLLRYAAVPGGRPLGDVTDQELKALVRAAKGFALPVRGTEGFESAQVTAGGIRTDEFDPATMGSLLVPGLYACGEVLDIDGDCGGYNLQWAWASGRAAGRACR